MIGRRGFLRGIPAAGAAVAAAPALVKGAADVALGGGQGLAMGSIGGLRVDGLTSNEAMATINAAADSVFRRRSRSHARIDLDLQALRSTSAPWRVQVQERRNAEEDSLLERLRRDVFG